MIVYGVLVPAQVEAAMVQVASQDKFRTSDVVAEAVRQGLPLRGRGEHWNRSPAKHAASTVIQRLKRFGVIKQLREGVWARAANDAAYETTPEPEAA